MRRFQRGYIDGFEIFLACIIGGLVLLIAAVIMKEIAWYKTTPQKVRGCRLISASHAASTRRTHAVPVANGNGGVGVGMVTTGESEKFTTIWYQQEFGQIVCDDKNIFRWAKDPSDLLIKVRGDDYRCTGISR